MACKHPAPILPDTLVLPSLLAPVFSSDSVACVKSLISASRENGLCEQNQAIHATLMHQDRPGRRFRPQCRQRHPFCLADRAVLEATATIPMNTSHCKHNLHVEEVFCISCSCATIATRWTATTDLALDHSELVTLGLRAKTGSTDDVVSVDVPCVWVKQRNGRSRSCDSQEDCTTGDAASRRRLAPDTQSVTRASRRRNVMTCSVRPCKPGSDASGDLQ